MENILFRPARQADSRIIGTYYQEAADGVADYIWSSMREGDEDLLDVAERRFARTDTAFSFENAILAELDGEVIGLVLGFPMHVDPEATYCGDPVLAPYAHLEVDNSYYLAGFVVSDSYRNRGVGSGLMAEFEKKARSEGYGQISLIVFGENHGGRRFYERHGFREVDRATVVPHPMIRVTGDALLIIKKLVNEEAA